MKNKQENKPKWEIQFDEKFKDGGMKFHVDNKTYDWALEYFVSESIKSFIKDKMKELMDENKRKYHELLMAVESKYKGETRHETALRLIKESQQSSLTATEEIKR